MADPGLSTGNDSDAASSASETQLNGPVRDEYENCEECKDTAEDHVQHGNVATLHVDSKRLKEMKASKDVILKYVCALRNSGKGILLFHIENQAPDNLYHGWLDQKIDQELNKLIEDGDLFHNVYKKFWVSKTPKFLALKICGSTIISTVQYNTFYPTDLGIEQMSSTNIIRFFRDRTDLGNPTPQLRGIPGAGVYESRNTQFKHFRKEKETTIADLMATVLDSKGTKVGNYISAFSKQEEGGSYYFGIEEEVKGNQVHIQSTGFVFITDEIDDPKERFKTELQKKLDAWQYVFDYEGNKIDKNICKVDIINASPNRFILEVAVAPVTGIVFAGNPKSYYWNQTACKYPASTWIKKMLGGLAKLAHKS